MASSNGSSNASSTKTRVYVPDGYTFADYKTFVSQKGYEAFKDLMENAKNRDPDANDMYIYNDFFAYALLHLIGDTFRTMSTLITKSKWDEVYPLVEGLTMFFGPCDEWVMADDGELVRETNKAYGAALVTLLRGLAKADRLSEVEFPALETLLKEAVSWGEAMKGLGCSSLYVPVCKAIGKRLFEGKEEQRAELMKKRVEEWVTTLDEHTQKKVKAAMEGKRTEDDDEDEDEEDDDDDDEGGVWWAGATLKDENKKSSELTFSSAWKSYKAYVSQVPNFPLKGPPEWDLTKWSKAEKAGLSFDSMDDEEDF